MCSNNLPKFNPLSTLCKLITCNCAKYENEISSSCLKTFL